MIGDVRFLHFEPVVALTLLFVRFAYRALGRLYALVAGRSKAPLASAAVEVAAAAMPKRLL